MVLRKYRPLPWKCYDYYKGLDLLLIGSKKYSFGAPNYFLLVTDCQARLGYTRTLNLDFLSCFPQPEQLTLLDRFV